MTTDPILAAKKIAEQAVQQRVALVQNLVDARGREEAAAAVLTAAKKMANVSDGDLVELVATLTAAAESVHKHTKDGITAARRAAEQGGWSTDELRSVGALPPKQKRKPRAAAAGAAPATTTAPDDTAAAAEAS